jgi:hypothetical protein
VSDISDFDLFSRLVGTFIPPLHFSSAIFVLILGILCFLFSFSTSGWKRVSAGLKESDLFW